MGPLISRFVDRWVIGPMVLFFIDPLISGSIGSTECGSVDESIYDGRSVEWWTGSILDYVGTKRSTVDSQHPVNRGLEISRRNIAALWPPDDEAGEYQLNRASQVDWQLDYREYCFHSNLRFSRGASLELLAALELAKPFGFCQMTWRVLFAGTKFNTIATGQRLRQTWMETWSGQHYRVWKPTRQQHWTSLRIAIEARDDYEIKFVIHTVLIMK